MNLCRHAGECDPQDVQMPQSAWMRETTLWMESVGRLMETKPSDQ